MRVGVLGDVSTVGSTVQANSTMGSASGLLVKMQVVSLAPETSISPVLGLADQCSPKSGSSVSAMGILGKKLGKWASSVLFGSVAGVSESGREEILGSGLVDQRPGVSELGIQGKEPGTCATPVVNLGGDSLVEVVSLSQESFVPNYVDEELSVMQERAFIS